MSTLPYSGACLPLRYEYQFSPIHPAAQSFLVSPSALSMKETLHQSPFENATNSYKSKTGQVSALVSGLKWMSVCSMQSGKEKPGKLSPNSLHNTMTWLIFAGCETRYGSVFAIKLFSYIGNLANNLWCKSVNRIHVGFFGQSAF